MDCHFTSAMAPEFEAFFEFKRALGYRYARAEFHFLSLDRFLCQRAAAGIDTPFDVVMLDWLALRRGRKPVSVAAEVAVLRQFCLFRRRRHPDAFVPGREWAPQETESHFLPYVFTLTEVRGLLDLTSQYPDAFTGLTMHRLILVLYCTGLRFGEPFRLRCRDVDLAANVFFIRESKGRSRLVPFGEDLAVKLREYVVQRNARAPSGPDTPFFVRADGTPLTTRRGSDQMRDLLRKCSLKPPHGRVGPRPYDLRHTFAVHRLTRWYHEGVADLHAKLPWLSAYMGHYELLGTEVYLRATPELMAIAAERFEKRLASAREHR
jgi:integrase/recombinase XerD